MARKATPKRGRPEKSDETIIISARVSPDVYDALRRAAEDDERSISQMVNRTLRASLEEQGYLK